MKNIIDIPISLQEIAPKMNFVFNKQDLAHLFGNDKIQTLNTRISLLIKRGYLNRAVRGIFYTKGATLEDIALKIYPEAYLSLSTALSIQQMIGVKPSWNCDIITSAPKGKQIKTTIGTISMKKHKACYHFGIEMIANKKVANTAKTFLDTCYFYLRGNNYPFDIGSDIDISKIDLLLLHEYLERYDNPKFKTFTKGVLANYGC
jgi:predicted transcriptional regulator of viral defense system